MKKNALLLVTLILITVSASAQKTYYINAPKFIRPLITKWIEEYQSVQQNVRFEIAKDAKQKDASALTIRLSDNDIKDNSQVFFFGQYATLPVTSLNSEAATFLARKDLNAKRLKELFFLADEYEDDEPDELSQHVVVYTGNGALSVSAPYAHHFGNESGSFRGKKIVGDDSFLNNALAKDNRAITINALSNIYDLESRTLKANLQLLPLDVDKSQKEALASLDALILLLENKSIDIIPTEKIGFTAASTDPAVQGFLSWILTGGVAYNHDFGILNLKPKDLAQESSKVQSSSLTAQK